MEKYKNKKYPTDYDRQRVAEIYLYFIKKFGFAKTEKRLKSKILTHAAWNRVLN